MQATDRDRDKSRDKDKSRDRDKSRNKDKSRDRDKGRDKEKSRDRDKSRDRVRKRDKDRDKDKNREPDHKRRLVTVGPQSSDLAIRRRDDIPIRRSELKVMTDVVQRAYECLDHASKATVTVKQTFEREATFLNESFRKLCQRFGPDL